MRSPFSVLFSLRILPCLAMLLFPPRCFSQAPYQAEKLAISRISGEKVAQISPTRFGSLLEVVTDKNIYYTDPGAHFLMVGAHLLDLSTRANLTAIRRSELDAINFNELPFQDAIKTVKGNGRRVMAVFSDVNCGYCKKLEKDLQSLDDTTVYTFVVGILSAASVEQGIAIWCAPDRVLAWRQVMADGQPVLSRSCAGHPVGRNLALSKKMRVAGTPTLFFPSGERVTGMVPLAAIDARLTNTKH